MTDIPTIGYRRAVTLSADKLTPEERDVVDALRASVQAYLSGSILFNHITANQAELALLDRLAPEPATVVLETVSPGTWLDAHLAGKKVRVNGASYDQLTAPTSFPGSRFDRHILWLEVEVSE
jgi:hypothetical protein